MDHTELRGTGSPDLQIRGIFIGVGNWHRPSSHRACNLRMGL